MSLLAQMAARAKVTLWLKMAARTAHGVPFPAGMKEGAKRDALASPDHVPEAASARIPLIGLGRVATRGCKPLPGGRGTYPEKNWGFDVSGRRGGWIFATSSGFWMCVHLQSYLGLFGVPGQGAEAVCGLPGTWGALPPVLGDHPSTLPRFRSPMTSALAPQALRPCLHLPEGPHQPPPPSQKLPGEE